MDMTFYDARYVYKQRVIQPKDESLTKFKDG